jgi:hypothetical protein
MQEYVKSWYGFRPEELEREAVEAGLQIAYRQDPPRDPVIPLIAPPGPLPPCH